MPKIPKFECRKGCHDCCGLVPFTRAERDRAAAARPLEQWVEIAEGWVPAAALDTLRCPFLGKNGCAIYEDRPTVCRLFGAVHHPLMECPHGCGPKRKLTYSQSRRILASDRST